MMRNGLLVVCYLLPFLCLVSSFMEFSLDFGRVDPLEDINCTEIVAEDVENATLVLVADRLKPGLEKLFNIHGKKGYLLESVERVSDYRYKCERWNLTMIHVEDNADFGIYDEFNLLAVEGAQIIIGPDRRSIGTYVSQPDCIHCFAFYFLTSPVGIYLERELENTYVRDFNLKTNMSATYSLWPSPTSLINCIIGNVFFFGIGVKEHTHEPRVVILTYAGSEDAIRFVGRLSSELESMRVRVEIIDIAVYVAIAWSHYFNHKELNVLFKPLQKRLFDEFITNAVILYIDTPSHMKVKFLSVLFDKGTQLDRKGIPLWLVADLEILLDAESSRELQELDLVNVDLRFLRPCLIFDDISGEKLYDYCSNDKRTPGVEEEGFIAAVSLLNAIIAAKAIYGDQQPQLVLSQPLQSDCPEETMVSVEEMKSNDFLECSQPKEETVRRVGFPRRDLITTRSLKKGFPSEAMYMPINKYTMSERDQNDTKGGHSHQELFHFHMKDYVVFGKRPSAAVQQFVVVVPERPFVIRGLNDSYSGMCIDIYNAAVIKLWERGIALEVKFFEREVYGAKGSDGKWTGVFGELVNEHVDHQTVLAIGQISITKERAADKRFTFSPPFAHTTQTYMTRKVSSVSYLQFLRPFDYGVWLLLILIFVLSGVYLRIIQGWNPFREELPEGSNFNWTESLWHSYLIVSQIGAPFGAVHLPSRVFSVVYWFFALVVVGCYTGNLAGFLSEKSMSVPSIYELVNELGYNFGMLTNSSVSEEYLHQVLGSNAEISLDHSKLQLVNTYAEGVEKVRNEKYILVGTSLVMKNYEQNDPKCVVHVKDSPTFYSKRFEPLGFPMRSDWEYADKFKWAISKLIETGELQLIYNKWISPRNKKCRSGEFEEGHTQLDFENFVGLYILLSAGIFASFIFLALKLCHLKIRKKTREKELENRNGMNGEEVIFLTRETCL